MDRRERREFAQAIAYSLERYGFVLFNNDDGTRVYLVAIDRPVGWRSTVLYACSGCARRLTVTLTESATSRADEVDAFVAHAHAPAVYS